MRKIQIGCIVLLILHMLTIPAFALSLRFKFNRHFDYATSLDTCVGEKVKVAIFLDGWNTSGFSSESLFGVQIFLYYDKFELRLDMENSYPNDTAHGGPFSPNFSFAQVLEEKIKLVVADPFCVNITNNKLLWTLELETISSGWSSISIQADYPTSGFVSPGGLNCLSPYQENASGTTATFTIYNTDNNGNGCVDACECEADFDNDGSVNSLDVTAFLNDFGRNIWFNRCTAADPCNGDFNCDGSVASDDVTVFLEDFGRNQYFNPCPEGCYIDPCDY